MYFQSTLMVKLFRPYVEHFSLFSPSYKGREAAQRETGTSRPMKRVTTLAIAVLVLLGAFRCAKESADVIPADITATGGVTPGDDAPRISAVFPDGSAPPYPVDTTLVIVFSIPVVPATVNTGITITSSSAGILSLGPDYIIAMSPSNTIATITFSYGGVNPLPAADTVDVDIGAGILDSDGDPLPESRPLYFRDGHRP